MTKRKAEEDQDLPGGGGMTMRSGRKKRRRSAGTTGLTPEQEQQRRKKTKQDEDDVAMEAKDKEEQQVDDDDASMESIESEQEEVASVVESDDEEVPAAQPNGTATTSVDTPLVVVDAPTAAANGARASASILVHEKTTATSETTGTEAPTRRRLTFSKQTIVATTTTTATTSPATAAKSPAPSPPEVPQEAQPLHQQNEQQAEVVQEDQEQVKEEEEDAVQVTWVHKISARVTSVAHDYMHSAREWLNASSNASFEEEDTYDDAYSNDRWTMLTSPFVWFAILILLQAVCYPLVIHPGWKWVTGVSTFYVDVYHKVFGKEEQAPVVSSPLDILSGDLSNLDTLEGAADLAILLQEALTTSASSSVSLESMRDVHAHMGKTIRAQKARQRSELSRLKGIHQQYKDLMQAMEEESDSMVDLLAKIQLAPLDQALDGPPNVMWTIPDVPDCSSVDPSSESVSRDHDADDKKYPGTVSQAQAESVVGRLQEQAWATVREIEESEKWSNDVRDWVRSKLKNWRQVYNQQRGIKQKAKGGVASSSPSPPLASFDPQEVLVKRLEVDRADRLGQVDYASVSIGAKIIEASPSFVDTLPIGNRWLAAIGLRFYGYGPDVALRPTVPHNALGQCWSFSVNNSKTSPLAYLTVELARPIVPRQLVLEHALASPQTAIRNFGVIGFTAVDDDDDEEEESISLGSHVFKGKRMQIFDVDYGRQQEPLLLSKIRLEVYSHWGSPDYACLYRFRVLGDPEEEYDEEEEE